ncbi:MAG: response regulator [Myxococcales bacterium]|jgi:CheY-like chemotaxis protein|nr:response regulator [Myxococcales bacterium]
MEDAGRFMLLVEDNPLDQKLMLRALKRAGISARIVVLADGLEAVDFLLDPDNGLPAVVLLDINLPRLDGLEVVRRVRAEERTRLVPIVMLTTSDEASDLERSYAFGANSFVRKPVDSEEFDEVVRQLSAYWLELNRLPRSP